MAILVLPLIWLGILPSLVLYYMQNGSLPVMLGPSYGAPAWKHAWWFFLYILVIGGGQEELGWRGYLLPGFLESHNAVASSLLVGVVWSTWHLPFLFIQGSSLYGTPFLAYLIQLSLMSFIYTWIYNNTRSVFAGILVHTWSNFAAAYLMGDITDPIYGLLTLIVQVAIVIILLVAFGPKRLSRVGDIHKSGSI